LQELGRAVAVLARVGDERAAHGAVGADRVQLLGPGDPQLLLDLCRFGQGNVEAEARYGKSAGAGRTHLEELPTGRSRQFSPLLNTAEANSGSRERQVRSQPVDIRRSLRSSGSGLRRRSTSLGSHATTTPVAPAASCSRSAAVHDSRSWGTSTLT